MTMILNNIPNVQNLPPNLETYAESLRCAVKKYLYGIGLDACVRCSEYNTKNGSAEICIQGDYLSRNLDSSYLTIQMKFVYIPHSDCWEAGYCIEYQASRVYGGTIITGGETTDEQMATLQQNMLDKICSLDTGDIYTDISQ